MTTGHGCINDLWAFDLNMRTWAPLPSSGERGAPASKLATRQVALSAACCHAVGALQDGSIVAFGGFDRRMLPCRALQLAAPLVTNTPVGTPHPVPCGLSVRAAPVLLGQAHARCGLGALCHAQALLAIAYCAIAYCVVLTISDTIKARPRTPSASPVHYTLCTRAPRRRC